MALRPLALGAQDDSSRTRAKSEANTPLKPTEGLNGPPGFTLRVGVLRLRCAALRMTVQEQERRQKEREQRQKEQGQKQKEQEQRQKEQEPRQKEQGRRQKQNQRNKSGHPMDARCKKTRGRKSGRYFAAPVVMSLCWMCARVSARRSAWERRAARRRPVGRNPQTTS